MERKELDSWQKLIRVLTHEIMNSISPILSLTKSITRNFREENKNQPISPADITDNVVEKTLSGLLTISDTGEGLIDFVTKYRSLTRLPEPQLASFRIETLFNKVRVLMQEEKNKEHISLTTVIAQDGLELVADINQLEKVLINLVKNSVEALTQKDSGNIKLEAMKKQDIILLQVEDDGPGISPDIIDDIFVPFSPQKLKDQELD
jgi:C4-dicarboxylate-specific signal transduction histidine kinase